MFLEMWTNNADQLTRQYQFLGVEALGNTILDYAVTVVIFFVLWGIFQIFQSIGVKKVEALCQRTKTQFDKILLQGIKTIRPAFYSYLSFYIALNFITVPEILTQILTGILIAWIVYRAIRIAQMFIDYVMESRITKEGDESAKEALKNLAKIFKGALWVVGILMILANMGINVTSLIAGLGIGGVAIAIALQNILGDLFGSFAIHFDKPFVVGDFIIVGEHMGVVEQIGIKTTRIRALQGEEIVISNQELTASRVQNFKKMRERRITFGFGVEYSTPLEKLKKAPTIVEDIIKKQEMARFDRAHFFKFADSSLDFEVVYYVETGDYNKYMDIHQNILLEIKDALEKEGISMAFPTQTVHLER